jgi:hypothetical protein
MLRVPKSFPPDTGYATGQRWPLAHSSWFCLNVQLLLDHYVSKGRFKNILRKEILKEKE